MSAEPIRNNVIKGGFDPGIAPRTESGMTQEVYALLAQANLLRIRGNWQEAVDKCMEAMRLVPGNGAAQSLLGDIYENQGRIDEALQWYRMALDTNPNSPADKQKLNRLLAVGGQRLDDAPDRAPSASTLSSSVVAKSNVLRATAMICGACLFGVVLTAVVQSHGSADARSRRARAAGSIQSSDPVTLVPPSIVGGGVTPRDPFEVGLSNSLRAADVMPDNMRFADVLADPRNGRLTLTYVVRPIVAIDRDTVLRNALGAAESASKVPETGSYPNFTMRILLSSDDLVASPDTGSLIFLGDIARSDLVNYPSDLTAVTGGEIQAAFSSQWWAPGLGPAPTPTSPAPSPSPSTSAAPSTGAAAPSAATPPVQ